MLMGLAGAGKSTLAATLGGLRINRDRTGGSLRGSARALDAALSSRSQPIVLDNTYLTRASREEALAIAAKHGARVRGVFVDTPLHEAQVNVVIRMLERRGRLLDPEALVAAGKEDPNLLLPTALFRMARTLERPQVEEGFSALETRPFVRVAQGVPGTAVALDRATPETLAGLPAGPILVFGWREGFDDAPRLARAFSAAIGREIDVSICPHPSGPPRCWCRPPLPGLLVEFSRRRGVDLRASLLLGESSAHPTLAKALGMRLDTVTSPTPRDR